MNYHPLLVHFPIAFLSIYSLLEFVRFKRITSLSYWFYIKAFLVIIGTGSAMITYLSGKIIEAMFFNQIVLIHSRFAIATIITYSFISISYLISWIEKDYYSYVKLNDIWRNIFNLNNNIFRPRFRVFMALVGFVLITVTGTLGGIIAFGPGVDPFTEIINNLFFGNAKY